MTAAGPLVFPGSRVLAGWWQQLAPVNPQAIWVGQLLMHRIEALVWVSRSRALDRFAHLTLRALTLGRERTAATLQEYLHLDPQVIRQLLQRLQREGLVQGNAAGEWQPTALGRHALERGDYPVLGHERRRFLFVESNQSRSGPQFLALHETACTPCPAPDTWTFDIRILQVCVGQAAEWKRQRGFPLDVKGILHLSTLEPPLQGWNAGTAAGTSKTGGEDPESIPSLPFPTHIAEPPDWRRVIVDQSAHLFAVLVCVADDGLLGYSVRPEGWLLQSEKPAFHLATDWREVFPELLEPLSPETWRQAWRAWSQRNHLPMAEVETCALERRDHRLCISAPKSLLHRLKTANSQALRGEEWVLAGEGRIRAASRVELVEAATA